ncbi:hypothetical protein [Kitasatospora sp. NPDC059327]|uniref:hypothetical protein n=1 Tax=Kitasatospora sp. NPDC059327 TaxID=3346803 RepID=UPI003680E2AA
MSQRRSYPNSGDFNLDDLFRPEPGQPPAPGAQGQQPPQQSGGQPPFPPAGQPSGQPEYLGDGAHALPTQAIPAQGASWGGVPQPGYGAPQPGQAPETQYLPPYPAGDPQAGGHPLQPGYPQPAPGYPQPDQGYQQPAPGYPQQPEQGYPAYQQAPQEYPAPQGYGGQDHPTTQVANRGGGRPSGKLIIGGVVAGCAAAGILVAVLMSGGDEKAGHDKPAAPVATGSSPAGGPPAASGTAATVSPEVKAQAQALSDLLGTANDSRQAVIGAVGSVQKCDKLPESQQALTDAAGKRRELQTKLAALKTDKLPSGPQLVEQLNAAWQASATADDEYAAWAGDAQSACDPKKIDNQHYKNAVQASGTATTAKKQASGLWNTIAGQTGLPTRGDGDL